jgi:hypothetical protein
LRPNWCPAVFEKRRSVSLVCDNTRRGLTPGSLQQPKKNQLSRGILLFLAY